MFSISFFFFLAWSNVALISFSQPTNASEEKKKTQGHDCGTGTKLTKKKKTAGNSQGGLWHTLRGWSNVHTRAHGNWLSSVLCCLRACECSKRQISSSSRRFYHGPPPSLSPSSCLPFAQKLSLSMCCCCCCFCPGFISR